VAGRLIGQVLRAPISASASGSTLVAAVAGYKIRVLALFLNAATAVQVQFQSGSTSPSGDLTGHIPLAQNTGFVLGWNEMGWFETAVNSPLEIAMTSNVVVGGAMTYVLVPSS
jgi:hypothetical protein